MKLNYVLLLPAVCFVIVGNMRVNAQGKKIEGKTERATKIVNGRIVGFDMPDDWKIAERAKTLTYTNPFNQDIAARWVDGEIVYRVSFGEVKVDPKTAHVAKEYIPVYSAPGPREPPTKIERVPGQLSIYDTKPGDTGYSPIWHYHYVVVPRDYEANTLRSEEDVLKSGYRIVPVDYYSN